MANLVPSFVNGVVETDDQSWRSLHDVLSALLGTMQFADGLKTVGSKDK